jgi:hypothetical protein
MVVPSVDSFCRPSTKRVQTFQQYTSKSAVDDQQHANVSYEIARGDGSTGGGGLPMPQKKSSPSTVEQTTTTNSPDGLVRPKVGAEMPKGRPSWFRVPGPSQGNFFFHQKT